MEDHRRTFLKSLLIVGLAGLVAEEVWFDDNGQTDTGTETSAMIDRVLLTESYESLQQQIETPNQYDFGLTNKDGIFVGWQDSWVKIHDRSPSFDSFEADEARVGTVPGPTGLFGTRELVSEGPRTVRIPEDIDTIQAALSAVPLFNRHQYHVDISPGVYDEDVIVPPVIAAGMANTDDGRNATVTLHGGGRVLVNSITVLNPVGCTAVGIHDIRPTQLNPYSDEQASVAVYGGQGQTYLSNINFGAEVDEKAQGIMAYGGAMVRADDCSFGDRNMRVGFHAKSQGRILALGATGTVTDYPYSVSGGWITYSESTMSGDLDETETILGMIYDGDTKTLHGVSNIVE